MYLKEFDSMILEVADTKVSNTDNKGSVLPALLLLLDDAREVLFPKEKYKPLRKYQILRIWKMAKIAVKLINTLMAIFRK